MLNLTHSINCPMGSSPVDLATSQTLTCIAQQWPYRTSQWVKHTYLEKNHQVISAHITTNFVFQHYKQPICAYKDFCVQKTNLLISVFPVSETHQLFTAQSYAMQRRICREIVRVAMILFCRAWFSVYVISAAKKEEYPAILLSSIW